MKIFLPVFLVLLALAPAAAGAPNVLFIAIDDLRPELGCYGVDEIISPNIDRLAASGVRFDRAYCQVAVCNPSRVSLLTGLRPDSAKVWTLDVRFRDTVPDVITLPQHFKQHGYRTVSYGKIFHNPWPDNVSWSEPHEWPKGSKLWSKDAKKRLAEFREQMRADGKSEAAIKRMRGPATEIVDMPDHEHIDGAIAEQALVAMRRLAGQDEPFFLAAGFVRPHLPFVVPRKYWELYDREKIPLEDATLPAGAPDFAMNTMYELRDYMDFAGTADPCSGSLSLAQQRELKHGYHASVSFIDAQVGRLLNELETLGIADDTIVVLWGDHGWKLGDLNSWCKQTNYEIDTRAPLIIRAPGSKGNGKATRSLVEFVDVYPTLCELAGIQQADHLEGGSLVEILNDSAHEVKDAAFSQFRRRSGADDLMGYAMRTDRYRYVEWIDRETRKPIAHELYDHETDPSEAKNIAADHQQLLTVLSSQLWKTLPEPPKFTAPKPKRPVLRFQNERDETLIVHWLADDGKPRKAGEIKPGGSLRQNSTKGHRFRIEGTKSDFRRVVRVTKKDETIVLAATPAKAERPNIVVIMGDDWSWPHAGILGDPVVKTPTFDRIAREGVLFENAYVSSPSCTPSRFAVATGQYHWRLGEGDSLGGSLATETPVYPDLLADAGYETGYCRKGAGPSKHVYRGNDPFGPRFKDFDEFFEQRESGTPFCFWYGAGEPHRPYDWQASLESEMDLAKIAVPACLPDNETVRTDIGDYYLRVQKLDQLAGEIVARLEMNGELENTIVVMTGDNGMPFPRCKATLYDLGTRAPLAIRWGGAKGARTVGGFVSLTDLAPTFLEAAGVPIPSVMTGVSLIPQLQGEKSTTRDFVLTGRERHVYPWPARAIRTPDFLLIRNFDPATWPTGVASNRVPNYDFSKTPWPTTPGAFSWNVDPSPTKQSMQFHFEHPLTHLAFTLPPEIELYDLGRDPDQMKNVAADPGYSDDLDRLSQMLTENLRKTGDPRTTP
ncbi:MAG: iduronate 2-sulfatase [Verrucomicrobiales bacterium]|jgi:iduronate 2-sulfatase